MSITIHPTQKLADYSSNLISTHYINMTLLILRITCWFSGWQFICHINHGFASASLPFGPGNHAYICVYFECVLLWPEISATATATGN